MGSRSLRQQSCERAQDSQSPGFKSALEPEQPTPQSEGNRLRAGGGGRLSVSREPEQFGQSGRSAGGGQERDIRGAWHTPKPPGHPAGLGQALGAHSAQTRGEARRPWNLPSPHPTPFQRGSVVGREREKRREERERRRERGGERGHPDKNRWPRPFKFLPTP